MCPDRTSHMVTVSSQLSHCYSIQESCKHILKADKSTRDGRHPVEEEEGDEEETRVCGSVSEALQYIDSIDSTGGVVVLVTGSLHLVGSVMSVLGFNVEDL